LLNSLPDQRVVCTRCGAINRIPSGKPVGKGKCGTCHQRLFDGHPADVDTAMLERQLSEGTLSVVVDIWAPWCGPCHAMAPEYEKATTTFEPRARFLKLNSDKEQAFASRLGIRGIPTMVVFKQGREVDRRVGAMSAQQIGEWLASWLDGPP
jgi:thioredoxin 2